MHNLNCADFDLSLISCPVASTHIAYLPSLQTTRTANKIKCERLMTQFTHLHVHSHFSILDGMSKIPDLVNKCIKNGMYAMALTDHGNMYGIKELVDYAAKVNGKVKNAIKEQEAILSNSEASPEDKISAELKVNELKGTFFKPIIGIEAYCAHESRFKKDTRGWHLILLAKDKQGYKNLCKLSSYAFTEGYYYNARIDHQLLEQYHDGIICCSACLGGEIPQKIMRGDLRGAEESVVWFKNLFGDDYYLELQRHKTDKPNAAYDTYEKQEQVNRHLLEFASKYNIKLVATNDVHFVEEEHGEAHDRLICLSTGKNFDDPNRLHYTKQEWLKSPEEMSMAFADLPDALSNTMEIADKVETYSIDSDPIMPVFPIPADFGTEVEYRSRITEQELFDEFTRNENGEIVLSQVDAEKKIKKLGGYEKLYRIKFEADYLSKLTYEGAHKRYGAELNAEQEERIRFELHTIKTMGFPGYFLIVQDYIRAARELLDVSVGPGRGSAAGSVVAYCLWITDVDPLKYDLLFERFLNPDRISLPDIDVDFDDEGRERVLDWITDKYGVEKVAHIITYGTMAAKSALADMGRIQKMPQPRVNQLKALIPDRSFPDYVKDENGKAPKVNLRNCYKYVDSLREIMQGDNEEEKSMLTYAEELEDTNRQVGIHACGVIIGADDLTNFAPVCTIKDKALNKDVIVTQYDGHVVESVGLIKMDFLGLRNLTILKKALRTIKKTTGNEIDIEQIPIDDPQTYQLFCNGDTVGIFQFESEGMQKYLRELQPHVFEDLIAMNALYRPGPMDYIPDFIARKRDPSTIKYDLPCMEAYLKDTYGITVYQEQVMLLSRQLAGFTRGQSDTLRKAMGKKQIEKMNELEILFYEGGVRNGHPRETLQKIWEDWKKFASYAFNKSHSTCYAWVAYQTAYLKAHYPAAYMAAVLTSNLNDIKRVTELIKECRRMGIDVLLPNINESDIEFSVNKDGQIRFGLGAIKGMGEAAADIIIKEREANGNYKDIFDFLDRVNMRTLNRKNIEVLVKSGAMDSFPSMHRAQYFYRENENMPYVIDRLVRYASQKQAMAGAAQTSIFDMSDDIKSDDRPSIPNVAPWSRIEQCHYEKEVIGFYISGHPLDDFRLEMESFVTASVDVLNHIEEHVGMTFCVGGVVTDTVQAISSRDGNPYGKLTLEDYTGSCELNIYGGEFLKYKHFFTKELFLFVTGAVVQNSYRKKDGTMETGKPKFRIESIMLLNDVLNSKVRNICFHVYLDAVTPQFCTLIKQTAHKNKGQAELTMMVHDPKLNLSLHLKSQSLRVTPKDFIHIVQAMPEVVNITCND